MNRRLLPLFIEPAPQTDACQAVSEIDRKTGLRCAVAACALAALLAAAACPAQVITIDTSGKGPVAATGPVDRQYAQIEPTHVELTKTELDDKTRLLLIRACSRSRASPCAPFRAVTRA